MNKNLLILGAGQYGQVAKEIAVAMGCFEKIDFLDDKNDNAIGKLKDYEKHSVSYSYAVVAIGNPKLRLNWIMKLEEACYTIAVLVHPRSYISPSAQIMKGFTYRMCSFKGLYHFGRSGYKSWSRML